MNKFAALALAATVSAFGISPALAADASHVDVQTVRISLVGKTDVQVRAEIRDAAATVCGETAGDCVTTSIRRANAQFNAITRKRAAAEAPARTAKLEDGRAAVATVRVALAGRSAAQVEADINAAADTVCKATNDSAPDYRACVSGAVRSAKFQLRQLAQVERPTQVASR